MLRPGLEQLAADMLVFVDFEIIESLLGATRGWVEQMRIKPVCHGSEDRGRVYLPFSILPHERDLDVLVPFTWSKKNGGDGLFSWNCDSDISDAEEMRGSSGEGHPVKGIEDNFAAIEAPEFPRRITVPEGEACEQVDRGEFAEAGIVLMASKRNDAVVIEEGIPA